MSVLKIAFVKSANEVDADWYRPLTCGYLMAAAEKRFGDRFQLVPLDNADNLDGFHVLAVSSTSQDFANAIRMAEEVKARYPGLVTIMGGNHISLLPQTLPENMDIAVIGEGEDTFCDLIQHFLDNGVNADPAALRKIPGLLFRHNGVIETTPLRALIEPLDNVPHPVRRPDNTQYLFTSRGCPYRCAFCSSCVFWSKTRMFSADYVVEEIEQLLEDYPETRHIPIMDDLFIVNRKRLERIITLLEEKRLVDKVAFSFSVRANLVDDALCDLIKRLRISSVSFGAESASDRILEILKKQNTAEINQRALDVLFQHKIPTVCSFIIGVPTETEAEVLTTYQFLIDNIKAGKLSADSAVNILMPLPGTPMWDYAVDHGMIDISNFNWLRLAVFASYRHSSISSFEDWIKVRQKNDSIYLNQDTLPESRLYEIMAVHEAAILDLQKSQQKYRKSAGFKIKRYVRRNILKQDPD